MKKNVILIITLCLFTFIAFAQVPPPVWKQKRDKNTDLTSFIFNTADPIMDQLEVPEEHADESAIILGQKTILYFEQKGKLYIEGMMRQKIKLQDKSSLEKFSEFYFQSAAKAGIQIIKASGEKIIVSAKEAIEVKTEVPRFFRSFYGSSSSYYKLALPNLEIGDIIDFYYLFLEKKSPSQVVDNTLMSAYVDNIENEYTTLKQEMLFYVDKNFFLNFNSYNGAPELKNIGLATNSKGKIRKNIQVYSLKTGLLPKIDGERWSYSLRSRPSIKFQPFYLKNNGDKARAAEFIGEVGVPKKSVSKEEIANYLRKIQYNRIEYYSYNSFLNDEKTELEDLNEVEIAKHFYYIYRSRFLKQIYYSYGDYYTSRNLFNFNRKYYISFPQQPFANTLIKALKKRKIEAEYLVTVPRFLGDIDDVLLSEELAVFVYLPKSKRIIYPFDNHRTFDDVNSKYSGQKAYRIKLGKKTDDAEIKEIIIPSSTNDSNKSVVSMDMTLSENFKEISIDQVSTYRGTLKEYYSSLAFIGVDYVRDELNRFDKEYSMAYSIEDAQYRESKKQIKDIKQEQLESKIEEDFKLVSHDTFSIEKTGRYSDDSVLVFNEKFVVKDLTQKAGSKHLLKIGKLIGGQVALTEEEIEKRQSDIFYDFAREFNVNITLNIPEGYSVQGYQKLETTIESEFGAFIVKTKIKGNKLLVNTKKVYKKEFVKKENWKDIVPFLEAAYDFSQKKIVLVKN